MLRGKSGEIVSRQENLSQCGRVGSPAEAEGKQCNFQTQFVQLQLFFYDKILAFIMSIPPTFPILMRFPGPLIFAN